MSQQLPEPDLPPFAVGTQLEYIGSRLERDGISGIVTLGPGVRATIHQVIKGRRGTGSVLEDLGDGPISDTTTHGCSVWRNAAGKHRLIRPGSAHEWRVLQPWRVGDYVVEHGTEFGRVFEAGPRRVSVIWDTGYGTVTRHVQGYHFTRVEPRHFHGDEAYEKQVKGRLEEQLAVYRKIRSSRTR